MFRLSCRRLAGFVVVAVVAGWVTPPASEAVVFRVTFENLSPNVFTPMPLVTHDGGFDLFDDGAAASAQLERLAEDGDFSGVKTQAEAELGAAVRDVQVAGGAPIPPGNSVSVLIEADPAHPWLTHASMFAISNDAFIGGAAGDGAIDLFPGGTPLSRHIMVQPSEVWDAGTEENDELAAHVPALGAIVDAGTAEGGTIMMPHPGCRRHLTRCQLERGPRCSDYHRSRTVHADHDGGGRDAGSPRAEMAKAPARVRLVAARKLCFSQARQHDPDDFPWRPLLGEGACSENRWGRATYRPSWP